MSNAELAPITKASCLCVLNLSLTRLMLALLASHTATGRSLVCRTAPCALWPYGPPFAVPFRPSLRSLCGPACREQLGTSENSRARTPVFSRLSPAVAARCKVLNLRLFIGETGSIWLRSSVFGGFAADLQPVGTPSARDEGSRCTLDAHPTARGGVASDRPAPLQVRCSVEAGFRRPPRSYAGCAR
jgi:hypothetical protein